LILPLCSALGTGICSFRAIIFSSNLARLRTGLLLRRVLATALLAIVVFSLLFATLLCFLARCRLPFIALALRALLYGFSFARRSWCFILLGGLRLFGGLRCRRRGRLACRLCYHLFCRKQFSKQR